MPTTEAFLVAMMAVFALPYLVWRLGRTDGWAPLVVVQILAGIALGPGLLGAAFPQVYATVFAPAVIQSLNGIAWWAVMLFVFLAGLELDLEAAWRDRRQTGVTAALALGVPLAIGSLVACLGLLVPGWIGPDALPWQFVIGIGMACAVTALPILVLLLERLELMRQPLGQRVLRYASLDDVLIWGVMALILMDWERMGRQLAFILIFPAAVWAMRALLRRIPMTDRWYLLPVWLAAVSFVADWAGLHYMVGAFLAGATIDARVFDRDALDRLRQHVLLLLMPVFFLSTGLRTQWSLGGAEVLVAAAVLLAASVGGKLVGVHLAGRLFGWSRDETRLVGWLLQTKALIMIVFSSILLDKRLISADAFTALLLMAVASTMLTIPMTRPLLARLRGEGGVPDARNPAAREAPA